ncbi:Protein kintoun [Portunus trituberculatus]|uniref:Protein kintoun n=1 Tax=Portunus trituberculatus TaxID=210409 RepID=A0A5B7D7N5_PORTR|nr:Protein kintoun [Portunus trituberculatus]
MASLTAETLLDGISNEDCTLLAKSFKDKKFRQLLCDYAKEVNDPENRKQYEEEVIEFEKERGVEAVFIHPSPGFALTLRGDDDDGVGFVNICSSDVVQKPDLQAVSGGGKKCHKWSLPHAIAKPRREAVHDHRDRSRKPTAVYDVVFHPEALQLAFHSPVIKQSLIDTALDSLRKHYSVKVGKVEEVKEKQYIGMPAQSIIKRHVDKKHFQADEQKSAYKDHRTNIIGNSFVNVSEEKISEESNFVEPKYKLKYVRKMDIQDYSVQLIPQCNQPWQPQALELEVNLPQVSRASQLNCDIQQQSVLLTTESEPKYKLKLPLRYPIDEDQSTAKFDVSTQKLTLNLAVVPSNKNSDKLVSHSQSPPSDSGIECELDLRTNGDSDNVSEESVSSQDDGAKDVEEVTGAEEEDNVFEPSSAEHKLTLAPNYSVQQNKESMIISLYCGNVLPSSMKVEQVDNLYAGIEFSCIGGGQTLLHYSLKVDVSPHKIAASGLSHKEEEGKVVLMVKKAVKEFWETCKIGHGDVMTTINLPITEEKPKNESTEGKQDSPKSCACPPRSPRMARTVSMCETEASHPFRLRGPTCSWPRGILKHRVRSLSESQVGNLPSPGLLGPTSSSLDLEVFESKSRYDDEEGEESVEESVASSLGEKKSVRFNEVVSRQLFRSNSSILGQRAKNQRKALRKRKSQARRESESEKDAGINTSSGDSDLTTDAATDDDTDATNSNTTEVDVDSDANNPKDSSNINSCDDVLQFLKTGKKNKNMYKSTKHNNNNNNNNNSDDNSNNNSGKSDLASEKTNKEEEEEDNSDFIIKTSKKKKRKNRKNKMPSFEPSNTLIFQLDMDK